MRPPVRGRLRGILDALRDDDAAAVQGWIDHRGTHLEDTELTSNRTALVCCAQWNSPLSLRCLLASNCDMGAKDNLGLKHIQPLRRIRIVFWKIKGRVQMMGSVRKLQGPP